jgi:hypothetical protein
MNFLPSLTISAERGVNANTGVAGRAREWRRSLVRKLRLAELSVGQSTNPPGRMRRREPRFDFIESRRIQNGSRGDY